MMNTRQDNDVKIHTSAIYIEKNTKLSRPIGSGADYEEN